jgi:monoterpene epsilon-lactone hydrolase
MSSSPDNDQALRTTLMRTLVRSAVRPFFSPMVPVSVKRRGLWLATRSARPARGARHDRQSFDGVDVEVMACSDSPDISVVYLHGGAYTVGSPATHRSITSRIARNANARVYAVDYRLAPEHPFPAALDDTLAVYQSLLDQGVSPQRIILAGDSAGGGLALATALAARQDALPLPSALVLFSPWVDLTLANAARPAPPEVMLSWAGLDKAARLYAPGGREQPLVSPLAAPLHGLPPMLIQTGSEEILLAESQQLSAAVRAAGGEVKLNVFDGMWHVFQAHAGILATADRALEEVADYIRRHADTTPRGTA